MKDFLFTTNGLLAIGMPLVFWGIVVYFGWGITVDPLVKVGGAFLHALSVILGLNAWQQLQYHRISKQLAAIAES